MILTFLRRIEPFLNTWIHRGIWGELGPGICSSITLLYAESREGSTELGKRKETACGVEDRGRRIIPDAGILLFIQGAKGAGHKLHWDKQPGIALGNKGKDKAERPHPLTGAGYRQEIKLPLLLQRKTRCERTDLSQNQTCCLGLRVDMQRGCPDMQSRACCGEGDGLMVLQRGLAP